MSLIVAIGMIYYTATCIQTMVNRTNNYNESLKSSVNPEELGIVNINQTGMKFYLIAYNSEIRNFTLDILK